MNLSPSGLISSESIKHFGNIFTAFHLDRITEQNCRIWLNRSTEIKRDMSVCMFGIRSELCIIYILDPKCHVRSFNVFLYVTTYVKWNKLFIFRHKSENQIQFGCGISIQWQWYEHWIQQLDLKSFETSAMFEIDKVTKALSIVDVNCKFMNFHPL